MLSIAPKIEVDCHPSPSGIISCFFNLLKYISLKVNLCILKSAEGMDISDDRHLDDGLVNGNLWKQPETSLN